MAGTKAPRMLQLHDGIEAKLTPMPGEEVDLTLQQGDISTRIWLSNESLRDLAKSILKWLEE